MIVDLDLALVRSFAITAEELHFRRAAERLFITQQALSQRIRRLELLLGVSLFVRGNRSVALTEEGQRFLAPARRVMEAADAAVQAVQPRERRPLRVDVVDGRLAPLQLVRKLLEEDPELPLNLSMRQSLAAALPALARDEIDTAFGRVHDVQGWSAEFSHRLVRLEPLRALVPRTHPLAGRDEVRIDELRSCGIWQPRNGVASEWEHYVRRLADSFGLSLAFSGAALSDEHFLEHLWSHGEMACLAGADVSYAFSPDIRSIPLVDPTPVYPWSMVWRRQAGHPLVDRLVGLAKRSAGDWLTHVPGEIWLPAPDRALLRGAGVDVDAVRG
ncbi:LysR family transcriptional regulator [Streptomyces alboniger]|uniref:LysR family transcriptional regulator n=1 Tax=Streptomyces alboniger TaxID=132473 RepID=UPI000A9C5C32|nr:LysR family transcriptional regulator [Streptomyces alboniger]